MSKEEIIILTAAASVGIAFAIHAHLHNAKRGKEMSRQLKEFQKLRIPKDKFIQIFNSIHIEDPKVKDVWDCMSEALGNEAWPELILDMLLFIQGQSTLSGFNEFGIDDQDFPDHSVDPTDNVCLHFRLNEYYCSKSKLITAYKSLAKALKKADIHSWAMWTGDHDTTKYQERFL